VPEPSGLQFDSRLNLLQECLSLDPCCATLRLRSAGMSLNRPTLLTITRNILTRGLPCSRRAPARRCCAVEIDANQGWRPAALRIFGQLSASRAGYDSFQMS
jgi:hypothetical protein